MSIAQFFDSGGPIHVGTSMFSRSRRWRIELALNIVFLKVITFLPVNFQNLLKKRQQGYGNYWSDYGPDDGPEPT